MGQIQDFFRSHFRTFWLGEPKCSEIWSEKLTDLSHLGLIWPTFWPNMATLNRTLTGFHLCHILAVISSHYPALVDIVITYYCCTDNDLRVNVVTIITHDFRTMSLFLKLLFCLSVCLWVCMSMHCTPHFITKLANPYLGCILRMAWWLKIVFWQRLVKIQLVLQYLSFYVFLVKQKCITTFYQIFHFFTSKTQNNFLYTLC